MYPTEESAVTSFTNFPSGFCVNIVTVRPKIGTKGFVLHLFELTKGPRQVTKTFSSLNFASAHPNFYKEQQPRHQVNCLDCCSLTSTSSLGGISNKSREMENMIQLKPVGFGVQESIMMDPCIHGNGTWMNPCSVVGDRCNSSSIFCGSVSLLIGSWIWKGFSCRNTYTLHLSSYEVPHEGVYTSNSCCRRLLEVKPPGTSPSCPRPCDCCETHMTILKRARLVTYS